MSDDQNDNQADSLEAARQDSATTMEPDLASGCASPELTWIDIVLESETGEPVSDEEYFIVAADGSEHSGVLDGNGYARVDQIPPGTCKVSFPLLEDAEWDTQAGSPQSSSENTA